MNEQIKQAIESRISNGLSKEEVINEFVASGYSQEEASSLYAEATSVSAPAAIPKPNAPDAAPSDVVNTQEEGGSLSKVDKVRFDLKAIIALGLGAVAVVIVVLLMLTMGSPFNLLGGSAPYDTESDLIKGIIVSSASEDFFHLDTKFELALEPAADGTKVMNIDGLREGIEEFEDFGMSIPKEGEISFSMSADLDFRDTDNPEADFVFEAGAVLEPIFFDIEANYRMVDGNMYVIINDVPTMWESLVADEGLPLKQWILVGSVEDLLDGNSPLSPAIVPPLILQNVPMVNEISDLALGETLMERWIEISSVMSEPVGRAQAATANMAFVMQDLSEVPYEDDEYKEMIEQLADTVVEYPFFAFDGKVTTEEINGRNLFVYPVKIDYENIKRLIIESARISGEEINDDEVNEIMPKEYFDLFNEYVDISVAVEKDGTLAGLSIESVFVLPTEDMDTQVRIEMSSYRSSLDNSFMLEVPSDLHDKSLMEMQAEAEMEREREMMEINDEYLDASVDLKLNRATYLLEENGTYIGACDQIIQWDFDKKCIESKDSLVVYKSYSLRDGYYCADSSGGSGRVLTAPESASAGCGAFVYDNQDQIQNKYYGSKFYEIRGDTYSWKYDVNGGSYENVCTTIVSDHIKDMEKDGLTNISCEDESTRFWILATLPNGNDLCIYRDDNDSNDSYEAATDCSKIPGWEG